MLVYTVSFSAISTLFMHVSHYFPEEKLEYHSYDTLRSKFMMEWANYNCSLVVPVYILYGTTNISVFVEIYSRLSDLLIRNLMNYISITCSMKCSCKAVQ